MRAFKFKIGFGFEVWLERVRDIVEFSLSLGSFSVRFFFRFASFFSFGFGCVGG